MSAEDENNRLRNIEDKEWSSDSTPAQILSVLWLIALIGMGLLLSRVVSW